MAIHVPPQTQAYSISQLVITLKVVALVCLLVGAGSAQTASTWSGGVGNWDPCPQQGGNALWNTCPNWPNGNYTATIEGGPVTVTDADAVVMLSLTSGSSLIITPGYLQIGGPISNNGSITIGAGNGLIIETGATTTLSGTGTVNMTDPNARFDSSNASGTLINQSTIQGEGNVGLEGTAITNQGLISATTGTLAVYPTTMTNTGTMQAQSGAILQLIGGTAYNNTGGTIQALNGSTVQLFTNISGGTLTTVGSGVITLLAPGGSTISNLTNAGTFTVPSGASLNWTGTITNTGVFNLQGAIDTNSMVTLTGSGTIAMTNGQFNGINANPLINQQLIHGSGTFYEVPLTNQATIQADQSSATLYIDGGTTNNTGTLQATGGGTLELESLVNNSGGTIEAQTGSTVIITNSSNGSINGGTLTTSGTGTIQSQNGVLDGTVNIPTNAGTLDVNDFELFIQGTVNNTGTINLTGDSCVILNEPATLTGSGSLVMGPTSCFSGSGNAFTNESIIEGAGSIGDSNPMPITNGASGVIIANQSGGTLIIQPNSKGFTNTGTLMADAGSTLNVNGLLTNLKKGTLTKGIYNVSGVLDLQASIVTNSSNITLNGAAAEIFDNFDSVNALSGLKTNKGTLILENGQSLTVTSNLATSGKLTVGAGSSLTTGGTFTQTGGTTIVDGTLTAPTSLTLTKGTIEGEGTLAASVSSSAVVIVGDSSSEGGALTVGGSYTQNAAGTLDVAINGTQVGTQYSQLAVSNGVSLNGTLSIKRKKFTPAVGDTFTILTGSAISGTFSAVKGTSINSSEHFEVNYNSTSVTLTVVSGA